MCSPVQLSNRALRSPLTFQDVDGAIGLSDRDKVFFFAYELWWHLLPEVLELTTELRVLAIVESHGYPEIMGKISK